MDGNWTRRVLGLRNDSITRFQSPASGSAAAMAAPIPVGGRYAGELSAMAERFLRQGGNPRASPLQLCRELVVLRNTHPERSLAEVAGGVGAKVPPSESRLVQVLRSTPIGVSSLPDLIR
jgi:hypothetical protein